VRLAAGRGPPRLSEHRPELGKISVARPRRWKVSVNCGSPLTRRRIRPRAGARHRRPAPRTGGHRAQRATAAQGKGREGVSFDRAVLARVRGRFRRSQRRRGWRSDTGENLQRDHADDRRSATRGLRTARLRSTKGIRVVRPPPIDHRLSATRASPRGFVGRAIVVLSVERARNTNRHLR